MTKGEKRRPQTLLEKQDGKVSEYILFTQQVEYQCLWNKILYWYSATLKELMGIFILLLDEEIYRPTSLIWG